MAHKTSIKSVEGGYKALLLSQLARDSTVRLVKVWESLLMREFTVEINWEDNEDH